MWYIIVITATSIRTSNKNLVDGAFSTINLPQNCLICKCTFTLLLPHFRNVPLEMPLGIVSQMKVPIWLLSKDHDSTFKICYSGSKYPYSLTYLVPMLFHSIIPARMKSGQINQKGCSYSPIFLQLCIRFVAAYTPCSCVLHNNIYPSLVNVFNIDSGTVLELRFTYYI